MSYVNSFAVLLLLIVLAACESYDFTINEKVVYSPAPLFADFDIPDTALRECLEQAIEDNTITTASQLSTLNCSHAGITNLQGLSVFSGLTSIRLSSNSLRNLVELGAIILLEVIQLDSNRIVDPVPLYQLPALRYLDLSGNPDLQCPAAGAFLQVEDLTLPEHCR